MDLLRQCVLEQMGSKVKIERLKHRSLIDIVFLPQFYDFSGKLDMQNERFSTKDVWDLHVIALLLLLLFFFALGT
jgi:hypothetical protein